MDRFVTTSSRKNPDKPACNMSAKQRHEQYEFKSWTHASGDKLFCTVCNIVIDHTRCSSVKKHKTHEKHLKAAKRLRESQEGQAPATANKKQRTMTHQTSTSSTASAKSKDVAESSTPGTVSAQARNELCMEWVSMLSAANIPLSKTDHPAVRQFLHKYVENGGSIPHAKQLQECYLQREKSRRIEEVKPLITGKPLAIMTDEMSDANGRFVLNILAAPLELTEGKIKSFLLDTAFLDKTNHSTVGQAVSRCMLDFVIDPNDVVVFNTDNAAYMKKAYKFILQGLCPNSVHITCLAHIMNLLGESFKKPFSTVNKFVKNMNAVFWNAGARKARFLRHLATVGVKSKMPPNPIGTRWNCWYEAVSYHIEYMEVFKEFIDDEVKHVGSLAPNSLKELHEVFSSEEELMVLKGQMQYIRDKSALFVDATNLFQSQSSMAMSVWTMLQDLQVAFEGDSVSLTQVEEYVVEASYSRKMTLAAIFTDANQFVAEKLRKYLTTEGQPGIKFLYSVQVFDPTKLILLPESLKDLEGIPGMEDIPEAELLNYRQKLGPAAVKSSTGILDKELFWKSCACSLPELSRLAERYMYATVHSANAERSFSMYNLILSDRRRSLSTETLRSLLFLYYNKFAGRDFFD